MNTNNFKIITPFVVHTILVDPTEIISEKEL